MSLETGGTSFEKQSENQENIKVLLEVFKRYNIQIDPTRLEHFSKLPQKGKGLILEEFRTLDMNLMNIRNNEYAEYRSVLEKGTPKA